MDDSKIVLVRERLLLVEKLKRFAFLGVSTSAFAAIICVLSAPMVYSYMQHVQAHLQTEIEFCKVCKS